MSNKPSPSFSSNVERTTTLCLACSSSLPPFKSKAFSGIFTTNCCSRPICPTCLSSNPRLARYDPCLACLGGVGVINAGSGSKKGKQAQDYKQSANVDGAVRDEDTFTIGEDEDDEEDSGDESLERSGAPPPYSSVPFTGSMGEPSPVTPTPGSNDTAQNAPNDNTPGDELLTAEPETSSIEPETANPLKYYIKSGDNLQGVALRFGVNGRDLCRLNNLPPSTLTTTPHILHTRAFLTLPPSARRLNDSKPEVDKAREARIARERAEKRLQTLTKEVDWRVAKAYVALADDPDALADDMMKNKEIDSSNKKPGSGSKARTELEGRAVDRYLDDVEWEEAERRAGRGAAIQPFPYFSVPATKQGEGSSGKGKSKFWKWGN